MFTLLIYKIQLYHNKRLYDSFTVGPKLELGKILFFKIFLKNLLPENQDCSAFKVSNKTEKKLASWREAIWRVFYLDQIIMSLK